MKLGAVTLPLRFEDVRRNSEDFALMLDCFNRVGYDVDIADTAREFGITPPRLDQWASMQRA